MSQPIKSRGGSLSENPEARHHQLPIPSPPTIFAPLHETQKARESKTEMVRFSCPSLRLPQPTPRRLDRQSWVMHYAFRVQSISGRHVQHPASSIQQSGPKEAITFRMLTQTHSWFRHTESVDQLVAILRLPTILSLAPENDRLGASYVLLVSAALLKWYPTPQESRKVVRGTRRCSDR